MQRLLVVTATYLPPPPLRLDGDSLSEAGGKWSPAHAVTVLNYSTRAAFVNGLDDVMAKPKLSMGQVMCM